MIKLKNVFGINSTAAMLVVSFQSPFGAYLTWTNDLENDIYIARWMVGDEEESARDFMNKSYSFLANRKKISFEVQDAVNEKQHTITLEFVEKYVSFTLAGEVPGTAILSLEEFRNIVRSIEYFYFRLQD